MTIRSPVIVPNTRKISVSRQTNLGISTYDLDELYSPDTEFWKAKVLDLASPKYPPQQASAPTRYIFDRSRYNNHGTIFGATWVRLSSGLWVLSFDGTDDKVVVSHHASLNFGATDSFYIKVWMKSSRTTLQRITFKYTGTDTAWYGLATSVNAADGKAQFRIACTNAFAPAIEGNTNVCDDKWHQIYGIRDVASDVLRIVVDAVYDAVAVTDTTTGTITPAGDLGIGARPADGANPFLGTPYALMEIGLGAPTQEQIKNSRNREKHLFGV